MKIYVPFTTPSKQIQSLITSPYNLRPWSARSVHRRRRINFPYSLKTQHHDPPIFLPLSLTIHILIDRFLRSDSVLHRTMENYPILFPTHHSSSSSSSSTSFVQYSSHLQSNLINIVSTHVFAGSGNPSTGFSEFKDNLSKVSGSTQGYHGNEVDHKPINDPSDITQKKGKKKEKKTRRPRYAFQTRSQVDILEDGYRWRKYGQKAVKNNKFPRYIYTVASLFILPI